MSVVEKRWSVTNIGHGKRCNADPTLSLKGIEGKQRRNQGTHHIEGKRPVSEEEAMPDLGHHPGPFGKWKWTMVYRPENFPGVHFFVPPARFYASRLILSFTRMSRSLRAVRNILVKESEAIMLMKE
jgi:hypothetical protein